MSPVCFVPSLPSPLPIRTANSLPGQRCSQHYWWSKKLLASCLPNQGRVARIVCILVVCTGCRTNFAPARPKEKMRCSFFGVVIVSCFSSMPPCTSSGRKVMHCQWDPLGIHPGFSLRARCRTLCFAGHGWARQADAGCHLLPGYGPPESATPNAIFPFQTPPSVWILCSRLEAEGFWLQLFCVYIDPKDGNQQSLGTASRPFLMVLHGPLLYSYAGAKTENTKSKDVPCPFTKLSTI